jgi:hypothetical protein
MQNDTAYQSPRVLTPEQRKARDEVRKVEAAAALREHAAAEKAFHANRERLKAARLARERAAEAAQTSPQRDRK